MRQRAEPERSTGPAQKPARPSSSPVPAAPLPAVHEATGEDAARMRPLDLQRMAGNRAVTGALAKVKRGVQAAASVQRVDVKEAKMSETIHNQAGAGGKAKAKDYAITPAYQLTRNGDSGVTVRVRVKFLHQVRGADRKLIGEPVEIPANDPDKRREWAEKLVKEQVKPWNGKVTLTGEEFNIGKPNTLKKLPVTFEAVAVFGLAEAFDNIVIIHPSSVAAGSPGQPIDAGNYYINKGTYKADEKVIAAHEYGHLIGIPDEYSQSNEQMNALLHQAAGKGAPSSMAALDRKTVELMVMKSIRRPLLGALDTAMPDVVAAIRAQRGLVKKKMAAAARGGVKEAAVRAELEKQLVAAAEPGLSPAVPKVVAFQTTKNFSNRDLADATVEAGFTAGGLGTLVRDQYWKGLGSAEDEKVGIAGLGDVSINVRSSVTDTTKAGGTNAATATTAAGNEVGNAGGPGTFIGFPVVYPPSGLVAKLMAIPSTWSSAGSALEAGVSPAAFSAKMESILKSAGAAAAFASLIPGLVPKMRKERELYSRALGMVNMAANEASKQLSADLLDKVIPPVVNTGVADVKTSVQNEVAKVMGTPPSGISALGSNPAMNALASAMKARLDADKAATAGGGRDPVGTGKAAPDQDVIYDYEGLMGSHGNMNIRADQLAPLVKQFNSKCTSIWEKTFKAEVK